MICDDEGDPALHGGRGRGPVMLGGVGRHSSLFGCDGSPALDGGGGEEVCNVLVDEAWRRYLSSSSPYV